MCKYGATTIFCRERGPALPVRVDDELHPRGTSPYNAARLRVPLAIDSILIQQDANVLLKKKKNKKEEKRMRRLSAQRESCVQRSASSIESSIVKIVT